MDILHPNRMTVLFICLFVIVVVVEGNANGNADIAPLLLFTDYFHKSVRSIPVNGGNVLNELPDEAFGTPYGIAYDIRDNIVYVVDNTDHTIKSFRLGEQDSLRTVVQLPIGDYKEIAFDRIKNYLYLADTYNKAIHRISTDGTLYFEWVHNTNVHGVSVHASLGWIYWTEFDNGTIMRAPMTDPDAVEVIVTEIQSPWGIYVDTLSNRLVWCEHFTGIIGEASLEGENRKTVVELSGTTYHFTGINGHIYVPVFNISWYIYDLYNGDYTVLQLTDSIQPLGIVAIQSIITVFTVELTSDMVQPVATTTESTTNTDSATGTDAAVTSEASSASFTIETTNSNVFTVELTSNTVQPVATTTESTTNTDSATGAETAVTTEASSASFTIETTNSNDYQTTPADLQSPQITLSWPSFGPAAGGTWITVSGIDLPEAYNLTISLGEVACDTQLQNNTKVIGVTNALPQAETDLIGKPLPVSLGADDTVAIRSTHIFTYRENPVINTVHPKESIISGGTLLTVEGDNLDSVAVIWMEIIMILKTLKSSEPLVYDEIRTIYTTECQIVNQTHMHCPTPILDIPSGFLNRTSKAAPNKRYIHRQANVRKTINFRRMRKYTLKRRLKRETVKLEYSNDGDILEFYIGFRLDGVHDFENFTTIDVYTEPTFSFESEMLIFKAGQRLSFIGNGLDSGITEFAYSITIGTEDCVNLELRSNSLSCYPPQRKPTVYEDGVDNGDPQITIYIGLNLQHFAGYLRYPGKESIDNDQKLPLHIIIPATVIPAILIVIVVAAVCEAQRRRSCCHRQ